MTSPSIVYLGLGSNEGDRHGNLVEALQSLRAHVWIEQVSPVYETEPAHVTDQPRFLNLAVRGVTSLEPAELLTVAKRIESRMGRRLGERYGPRPIDIDILFYGDRVIRTDTLEVPHPRVAERGFVLVPLHDIAPGLRHPELGRTVAQLLAALGGTRGIVRVERDLTARLERDVQEESPSARLRLDQTGVTGLHRIIRLSDGGGLFYATLDLSIELPADQKGAHMSRFSDTVEEVLEDLGTFAAPMIETLAERIARALTVGHRAERADVEIRAQFPLARRTPVSGKPSQELYTLIGIAAANPNRMVQLLGVEAEGMMACPCAQEMVRAQAEARLLEHGLTPELTEQVLSLVPIATHNQRGRGRLLVGADRALRAEDLVAIVEGSMSSENYDLLKRPDELFVVEKAHRNPRFVEDTVREMLRSFVNTYPELPDDAYVHARQVNMETIHKHDVFAQRGGQLGEIRGELTDGEPRGSTALQAWLAARLAG